MMDRSQRLGEASIPFLLATFSAPAIVGMLAQAVYNVVDRAFVGHALGPDGIAGITVSLPFMLVLLACGMLIGFGAGALVSIRLGEGKKDEAESVLRHAVLLLAVVSLMVTVLGLVFLAPLLRLFGASDRVLPFGRDYLQMIVLRCPEVRASQADVAVGRRRSHGALPAGVPGHDVLSRAGHPPFQSG